MHTVLLIDDDEQTRKVFGLALRHKGYQVLEADSGYTGLEMAKKYLPDLILTDVNMPGGDGKALLFHIRQDPELNAKQVILMTGQADLVAPRTAMEAGADDFLIKPFTLDALCVCVEARLQRAQIHWRVEDRNLEKLRSSLLSTLPEELFTPLAGIMGVSEYLHSHATLISLDEMQQMHGEIYNSGLRLHRTLTNYFRILGLEKESERLNVRTLLPASRIRESIQAGVDSVLARPGPARTIALKVSDFPVLTHDDDLRTIVEELVDNARKFSSIGSEIKIELQVDGTLTVTNEGKGMTPEEIKQIGAFQQFDRTSHERNGLGLGLILVQKLAERNGARFRIDSEPSKTTTVRVTFRERKAEVKPADEVKV
jgi:signal transduction histidine kinase